MVHFFTIFVNRRINIVEMENLLKFAVRR